LQGKGVRPEVVVCVWRCLLQAAVAAAGIRRHKRRAMSALALLRRWAKKLRHPTGALFSSFPISRSSPLFSLSSYYNFSQWQLASCVSVHAT
jgi:hypothetical protein